MIVVEITHQYTEMQVTEITYIEMNVMEMTYNTEMKRDGMSIYFEIKVLEMTHQYTEMRGMEIA